MANTTVWSEVDPALTSYTDCTWCAILMVVRDSGFTAFPLGVNTHAERDAFRAGSPVLSFSDQLISGVWRPGGVTRSAERYGVQVISPTPYSPDGLRAALRIPGQTYALAGKLSNYPLGHPRRRWDPYFDGFHAVAVRTLGSDLGLWLDPLADMGFAGDTININEVVDTFALGNYPNDARYLPVRLEHDVNLKGTPVEPLNNRKTTVTTAAGFTEDPTAQPYNNLRILPAGTEFTVDWVVDGPRELNGTYRWYGGWMVATPEFPTAQFGYIISANCGPLVPKETVEVPGPVVEVEVPVPVSGPSLPAPTDVASAKTVLLAAGIDVDGARADLIAQTTALNSIATARTRAVSLKNAARTKLEAN